jgi:hypothetical protein
LTNFVNQFNSNKVTKMSRLKIPSFILLSALCAVINTAVAEQKFGNGANMKQLTEISKILASPNEFLESSITIEGTIVKVCKKRGCWMELASDKKFQTLRIKVRDGDMVFPMTALGKTAYATGQLQALPLDLAQSKRYLAYTAQEQQEEFDVNSVTEAITVYQISPTGVTIND